MEDWIAREGYPGRGGVTYVARLNAYNFAIYSKHATSVRLNLYRTGAISEPFFAFDLDVTVPVDLAPGTATIAVRAGAFDGFAASNSAVRITAKSPVKQSDPGSQIILFLRRTPMAIG